MWHAYFWTAGYGLKNPSGYGPRMCRGTLEIQFGKTDNARRRIPMTPNVQAIMEMRLSKSAGGKSVFPAPTLSGHIELSSLKKQHAKAISEATRILREKTGDTKRSSAGFEYTLRHTWLTRWAPHMDPWTLAYLAGHRDMNITQRYVHPQEHTILDAMEEAGVANGGHNSGHNAKRAEVAAQAESRRNQLINGGLRGAPGEIRTPDLLVRSQHACRKSLNTRRIFSQEKPI